MHASTALDELMGLSTQVVEAVIARSDGTVEAARTASDERAGELVSAGAELLAATAALRPRVAVERVHVDNERGSLVVARDASRSVVVTTVAEPTAGLVAYDLRTVLSLLREDS